MLGNLDNMVYSFGYEGENLYTQLRINCIEIFAKYPNATVSMIVKPPQGENYPGIIQKSGAIVTWDLTSSDLAHNGSGSAQLTFSEDGVIIKSVIFDFTVKTSLEGNGEIPTPIENWETHAGEVLIQLDSMTASAVELDPGSTPTARMTEEGGVKNIEIGIPPGTSGEMIIDTVTGSTPVITGVANHRYVCGTVTSISITPPQAGIMDVVFTSGATPTVLTIPAAVKLPEWFDKTALEANTTYEINIMDGTLGVVALWT